MRTRRTLFAGRILNHSDTRKIVADRDIYSQSGIQLWASTLQAAYKQLVDHKMLPSLDMALSIENMLDPKAICKMCLT